MIFFPHDAKLLEDGTLRINWGGRFGGNCLGNGWKDIPPDSPDYQFWLWLKDQRKRHWYQFGPLPGLDESAITKYREQFDRKHSQPSDHAHF